MRRFVFSILLAAFTFIFAFALADTEKIIVSPTFTEYLYTDIHHTEAGFSFVDASVGQYIDNSKYGNMLVVTASVSVDYDRIESNPVLFWNLYINGEKLAEVPVFSELPNAGSNRKDINYYADISFEGMIERAILIPVGNDHLELKKEAIIIIDDSSDTDQFILEKDKSSQATDISEALGYSEEIYRDTGDQIPAEVAFDITKWDQYWKPGEKLLDDNEETRNRVRSILDMIDQASAGTSVRNGADNDTVEAQYAEFQRMLQEGMNVTEQLFDDIGTYIWAIGLPDEQSISQDKARWISCQVLLKEAGISEEQMSHFYPHFTYETGDPLNPFWHITWMPFDQGADVSTIFDVAVYAHDGSVCGYSIAVPVG